MDIISEFSADRGLVLDDFQLQACKAILDGCSVLVAAPTGSGKTAIADFAAYMERNSNRRVIYTTPIKALSNQKYSEFCEMYGESNVGLATGDRSIRPRARITIMTTEVLRNMIYADVKSLDDVSHVILDEVHYISDRSRGAVWEEVIIQLPLTVDLVCLSATVSNAEEVAQWLTTVRGSTQAIIHETRPIPLSYWFAFRKKRQGMHVLPLLSHSDKDELSVHPDLYRALRPKVSHSRSEQFLAPKRFDLIDYLENSAMLPAIFFIFSRAGCDDALQECFNSHVQLTTSDERRQIREICNRHLDGLSNDEFEALDYDIVTHTMERGFAPHHAGLIPPLREAVEEAFIRGLIKVVFATETLAVGVNMPAKTVVIEKLTKYNGEGHDVLTPGEFTQLTGRAGRRGIDVAGHAIVEWNRFVDFEQAASLASTRSYSLQSSFRPTYNMATNLINAYSPSHARHLLNLSFAQFQADDAVVALERNLENKQNRMQAIRVLFPHTDRQFATLIHKRSVELEKKNVSSRSFSPGSEFLHSLHAGDIIDGFKHMEPCVVVFKGSARREPHIRVVDTHGRVHTLVSEQVDPGVKRVGHIDLPTPIAIRTKHFRVSTSIALRKALGPKSKQKPEKKSRKIQSPNDARNNDLLDEYLSCESELKRLTRRVQSRGQSLARQFERILALLSEYGYVEEWSLTDKGKILSRINAEADLLIAEFIANGELSQLNPAEFSALLATLIFESRGDNNVRPNRFPTERLDELCQSCEKFVVSLNKDERDAGIKETRGLDYSMMFGAYMWARGKSLEDILDRKDIAGGDFVRAIKSIVDLVRQIESATEDPLLKDLCKATHRMCFRDIIEISS